MVKQAQTIRLLKPTNCLIVFDHLVGLALRRLKIHLHRILRNPFAIDPVEKGIVSSELMCIRFCVVVSKVDILNIVSEMVILKFEYVPGKCQLWNPFIGKIPNLFLDNIPFMIYLILLLKQ